jgi:hypothetical protein
VWLLNAFQDSKADAECTLLSANQKTLDQIAWSRQQVRSYRLKDKHTKLFSASPVAIAGSFALFPPSVLFLG